MAVVDLGGVTRAAGFLHLTQSAISMQLKRLEELLGVEMLDRSGCRIALTASGEQLLAYARRMIAWNDELIGRLTDQAFEGEVVPGVPHDVVHPFIPRVLQWFNASFLRVSVNLVTSNTRHLKDEFARGAFDLIITTETGADEGVESLHQMPLRQVGSLNGSAWRQKPLRLGFCRTCIFRPVAIAALDDRGIVWDMSIDSDSNRTIKATVSVDHADVLDRQVVDRDLWHVASSETDRQQAALGIRCTEGGFVHIATDLITDHGPNHGSNPPHQVTEPGLANSRLHRSNDPLLPVAQRTVSWHLVPAQ